MPAGKQNELDLGLDPLPATKMDLTISAAAGKTSSPAQVEFNRRMKALEKARKAHDSEQAKLDRLLDICIRQLMPLVEEVNRANRDLVFLTMDASKTMKLTPRRQKWLADLISGKASELLGDPVGLSDEDFVKLEAAVEELGPCAINETAMEQDQEQFAILRAMMEQMARRAGVDLDLSNLDIHSDPADIQRQMQQQFAAAGEAVRNENGTHPESGKKRKPSKAVLERERQQREMEEAKTRDFKALYKQLAKLLHPDLEIDPVIKEHKEGWMKRLTAAHAGGDLRDMLEIEMEWLGEEAGNLARAGDEKLRVYSMLLKEQIEELKDRTELLIMQPKYGPLARFQDPFSGRLPNPAWIHQDLADELERLDDMLDVLRTDDIHRRKMIHSWADANARGSK